MAKVDLVEVLGVGPASAEKLSQAGIKSVRQLAETSEKDIALITGFPETRAAMIKANAERLLASKGVAEPVDAQATSTQAMKKQAKKNKAKKKKKKDGKGKKKKKKGKKKKKK